MGSAVDGRHQARSPGAMTRTSGSQEPQRALQAAVALAEGSGAELRVISAFQAPAFGGVTTSALVSTSANEAMRTELRASPRPPGLTSPGGHQLARASRAAATMAWTPVSRVGWMTGAKAGLWFVGTS